jgi:hypothetical protein
MEAESSGRLSGQAVNANRDGGEQARWLETVGNPGAPRPEFI